MEKIVTKRVNLETVSKKQSYSEVSIDSSDLNGFSNAVEIMGDADDWI